MKRKLLAILLAVSMFVSTSVVAMAAETTTQNDTADVTFTFSYGYYDEDEWNYYGRFFTAEHTNEVMAMKEISVPYFDLGAYGLSEYYYNEHCYDNYYNGGPVGGDIDSANGHITMLHAMIYATELYYCGLKESQAGKGFLYNQGLLDETFMWKEQQAGQFFLLNFWGIESGGSLMYYVNHQYPLGCEGIGATMDQIELEDGDHISFHLMGGYGDSLGMYATSYGVFECNDQKESVTVELGETLDLNLAFVSTFNIWGQNDEPIVEVFEGLEVRCTDSRFETYDEWDVIGETDSDGNITIDTSEWEAGSYCLTSIIPYEHDAYMCNYNGFEYAPASFVINVIDPNASEAPDTLTVLYGDVNGDGAINSIDASKVLRHEVELETLEGNALIAADVNGDETINAEDAALILRFEVDLIDKFPVEKN